jgi:hypothetical protein
MGTMLRRVICLALLSIAGQTAAKSNAPPELLLPVDDATVQRLTGPMAFDLRKRLYFAKRYRIVKVDIDLLQQPGITLAITPFPDAPALQVRAESIQAADSAAGPRRWRGEILDVIPESQRATYEADPERQASLQLLTALELRIRERSWDVPPAVEAEFARSADAPPRVATGRPDRTHTGEAGPGAPKMLVRTVSGQWLSPVFRAMVVLAPVEEDPRYHLIYVEDPEKRPEGPNFEERRRRFTEFSERIEAERKQHQDTNR